ncbi:D-alanyl-D-alanine carboxypeptidase/D-alanyl-D-alanine endopeptidase [Dyadobacter sediminis]|uniref:D-alanyl-D-alanine carboxypeptidase/D-alanyl-D-alanine-endopeptidase n=1 Tax=Dyadobacter sediminis TaxID=1493691 RepID=A0A5R9KJY1_9BACT|nr:D-alanyl-D-alanine carboxypeptidase/D-alanyl-D-alanine-endopeptidase [Dyadobacter sediminis]TLU96528.1 D-alanyl-D-alanine carboxypeptidase/D-alanyl-D-alanine-endopeptidase [Dyadobacter sediminis]GGB82956.1 peptidase S13 [Dyadobacter sediminis]
MKFSVFLFFVLFQPFVFAQTIDTLALNNLQDAVLEVQNSELMRSGSLAVSIKSVKEGTTIFALNPERSLPSASTLKLVSTATALAVFGGDFRFQTFLEHDGIIRNDTLVGNIYIRGTGDPSLGSERFKGYLSGSQLIARWIAAISKTGIVCIRGKVLADDSFFDTETVASTWIWGDMGNYYGAGVQGLNFMENQYKVRFRPGADVGDPAAFAGIEPLIPYLSFTNQVTTGERGSGDQTIIYSSPLGNNVVLTGTVPAGVPLFSVKGSIPDAAGYTALALKSGLKNASVTVLDSNFIAAGILPVTAAVRVVLDEYKSPPLREICQQTNFWSVNLFADAFFKQIGKKLSGKSGFESSAEAVTTYWLNRSADMRGFYIKDGSGLSPSGSVTTSSMTDILNAANRDKSFGDFYKSIAVLGLNGTVRNLGKGSKAAGNMHVKSGSIEGTRAYAGYVTSKSGSLLSFSVIAHKYLPGSNRIVTDQLVKLMTLMAEL